MASTPGGRRSQAKKPPVGSLQRTSGGMWRSSARAPVCLDHPLPEAARTLVRRLLGPRHLRDHLGRPRRPAETHAGAEDLRERAGLHDDVGGERPQRGQRAAVEGQVAVGDVLEDQHAVAAAQLDQRMPPLERERSPGRVLELRDDVGELGTQPVGEARLERVDEQAVLVHRDPGDLRVEAGEGHQRTEVRRRLDDDGVARVEQAQAGQCDALHAAARDDQLVELGPPPLRPLLALEQVLAHAGDALARRVLERHAGVVAQELRHDLVEQLGRERRRVGEAARDREHPGRAAGQDRRELRVAAVARAPGERARPRARAGRRGHQTSNLSALCSPRSSAATCSRQFVRSWSAASSRPTRSRIDRSLRPIASAVSSAASKRSAGAIATPSSSPKTMSPGATSTPPQLTGSFSAGRATVEPERGIVPRAKTGSPSRRRPATSRQRPSITTPASPRRRASVANSSPSTATLPSPVTITSTSPAAASASPPNTGRWSSGASSVKAGPAMRTSGTMARIAGSSTGSPLSASQTAETSSASSRSITALTIRLLAGPSAPVPA